MPILVGDSVYRIIDMGNYSCLRAGGLEESENSKFCFPYTLDILDSSSFFSVSGSYCKKHDYMLEQ